MGYPGPQPQGLYDPAFEHDACGVAFVADIHGLRDHHLSDEFARFAGLHGD